MLLLLLLCTQSASQSLCLSVSLSLMLLSGAKSFSGSLEPPRYLLSVPTARTEMQCFLSVRAVHMASGDRYKYNPRYGPHTAASTNQNSTSIFCCTAVFIMRPSSLGGGCILRRTLSVRPSRYRCHWLRLFGPASVTSRHLANYNDTHVGLLFGTH